MKVNYALQKENKQFDYAVTRFEQLEFERECRIENKIAVVANFPDTLKPNFDEDETSSIDEFHNDGFSSEFSEGTTSLVNDLYEMVLEGRIC